jgi:hypothetical protein
MHEVRQFLGLCNIFCCHVRNFAQLTALLNALTKKECSWKGGVLPPDACNHSKNFSLTCAPSLSSTTPRKIIPAHSSLTPASEMTKCPGAGCNPDTAQPTRQTLFHCLSQSQATKTPVQLYALFTRDASRHLGYGTLGRLS